MLTHLNNLWQRLRASLWLVPSVMCLAAFGLALLADKLDRIYHVSGDGRWPKWLIYQGDLEGARTLLSSVAGSMITVAGTTFSITMVVLQLASSQFGPRLLTNFMRDTGNQFVLGTFVSTFLYCLLALGNGGGISGEPPAVSATLGLLLAVLSVFVFIYFIHHVSSTIRAEHVVQMVAFGSVNAIKRLTSPSEQDVDQDFSLDDALSGHEIHVRALRSGYLQAIDEQGLSDTASSLDGVFKVHFRPGKFITANDCLATLFTSQAKNKNSDDYSGYFIIGHCRTDEQDPEYGISQLVEVAVRALSPGINDPHTAISCIDWLNSGLKEIANQPLKSDYCCDEEGELRLVRCNSDFAGLLNTAYDQIRQNSIASPAVAIHLAEALADLYQVTESETRRGSVHHQAQLILTAAKQSQWLESDLEDLENRYQRLN
ncbi:DUF2254 domain-containing protein [Halioxenophilus aromaticivorans]|uniref:DUF2254 domain-containing protein n=1 Tax=Halioxenophilus aromaticivorans TaxID=1306992 RepID=A0AAV3U4S6_9ALTE